MDVNPGRSETGQAFYSSSPRTFVVAVWALSRIWLGICAYAGHISHPFREPIDGGFAGVSNWWLNVWTTHDSAYLLELAREGYRPATTAFFPLMPLLLRPFAQHDNLAALAAIVISNVSFLVALWLLLRVNTQTFGGDIARRSVAVLAFFPTAVFMMAVYTDALFLALTVALFHEARAGRWWSGMAIGMAAGLTRTTGPVLAVAVFVVIVLETRGTRQWRRPSIVMLLCAAAPLIAFLGVQAYFRYRFGAVTLLAAQREFGREAVLPWIPIWRDIVDVVRDTWHGTFYLVTVLNVAASILVFVFAWRYRRAAPASEMLLMCGVMLMQLTYARTFSPYTISSLRYVLSTPVFFSCLALAADEPKADVVRLGLILSGLLMSGGIAFLFGTKDFVS